MNESEVEYVDQYPSVGRVEQKKMIIQAKCLRCGGVWCPKTVNGLIKNMPKFCTHCKSPYWNKPRLERGVAGAVNKYGFDTWEIGKWYSLPKYLHPDGSIDMAKNETRWRSLAQFARRRGLAPQFDANKGPMFARLVK